jgi:hypothetical protein
MIPYPDDGLTFLRSRYAVDGSGRLWRLDLWQTNFGRGRYFVERVEMVYSAEEDQTW